MAFCTWTDWWQSSLWTGSNINVREQRDGHPSIWDHPRAIKQCGSAMPSWGMWLLRMTWPLTSSEPSQWNKVELGKKTLSLSQTHTHTHTPYLKVIQHCLVVNSRGPRLNLTFVQSLPHDYRHISLLFCAPGFSSVIQILTGLFCWQD